MSAPPTRRDHRLRAAAAIDASSERSLETLALAAGALAFVLSAAVALVVFRFGPAPIAGPGSIGQYAAISGAVVAILAFAGGRYVVHTPGARVTVLDIVDIAALAFAHAVIALFGWTLLAVVLEQAFIDAEVFAIPVIVLAGTAAAVTAYVAFYSATHMNLEMLALVLASFLVGGILTSMLTASDPHWWMEHLSALGMTDDLSSLAFNLTLIVAGIIVTTLARYATRGIPTDHAQGIAGVRLCLILVGVFLGFVGVFPVDDFFWIHTAFASGMAVVFGVLVIRLPRWIPGVPRAFVLLGWVFIAVILTLAVLFIVSYYTLTAVELVAGVLVFTWIILFIRNAGALQQDADRAAVAS